ncbi:hypothetical protein [Sphingomonas aracearum]|uniref:Uncharacterized protein n=1 Tax=Sphingomonas aracearum TaxID=2283317 RepID=A0A369VUI8_9SPHN|nr:hypothetical protein [Sphingomonas aracearum]RDE06008.1 hypothetical protein DVW87_12590 [Sphingomonas aracearum]
MRNRRIALGIAAAALALLAVHRPTAQFTILTHDHADLSPHKLQAAVDLGPLAVHVLYTWTEHFAR